MYWLAEQGSAPKRVFLVILPLIINIIVKFIKTIYFEKGECTMINTIDVPYVLFEIVYTLSGNIAGGALLTNALHKRRNVLA